MKSLERLFLKKITFHLPKNAPPLRNKMNLLEVAFHPESDFGPEHDFHPMINRL